MNPGMMNLLEHFHWIRPAWLWALLPLALLLWLGWRYGQRSRGWQGVVDPRLLPWLLVGQGGRGRLWPLAFWALLGVLTIVSLAGPSWRQLPTPVYQRSSALIVALDLSASMNAQDIKPSRIARARLKLIDLLKQRQRVSGQTALIAFAGTAYTVTPLTDDVRTIESLVSSLTPEIMPAQGSRVDRAIDKAKELLVNAGLQRGDLLLITDGMSRAAEARLQGMDFGGLRISVMAVGTPEGAPIPDARGGFVKDRKGDIVIARLDEQPLQQLAARGGGIYTRMRIDDADLKALQDLIEQPLQLGEQQKQADFKADRWREEGPWLLLLVVPLAALAMRRGFVITLLLALLLAPAPQGVLAAGDDSADKPVPAEAAERPDEAPWQRWLLNPDQRARKALEAGDAETAKQLFRDPKWKASAAYKAGRYDEAARLLESLPQQDPDTLYNRANALARSGRLEEALKTYDEALKLRPQDEDARYNRKLVEEALKQQRQQNQQGQNQQGQNQQGQNQQGQNQQGQNQQGQNQQGQNQQGQNQQGQNQQGQNQQGQNQQGQNQQGQNQQGQNQQGQNQQGQNQQGQNQQGQNQQGQNAQQRDAEEGAAAGKDEQTEQAEIERLRAEAEAERRKREQQADDSAASRGKEGEQAGEPGRKPAVAADGRSTQEQTLDEQAEAQWLRRIPDDPGGLLRNKFRYQYSRQRPAQTEDEPW